MTKVELVNNVSRTFHKVGFQLKKHSPEILVVTGIVGMVASAVTACKATTKVDQILEKTKYDVEKVHECLEKMPEEYTQEDSKKDLSIIYGQTGLQFAKLYAPSVILGVASITCILAGHNILSKRNVALAAAYATVDSSFKEYRGRVIERFGKELDRELKYNIKAQEVEAVVTNEDGTETTVKETVETASLERGSEYAFFFDETCSGWTRDAEYNKMVLVNVEREANRRLQRQGYFYLNDLHKMLGAQATKAGQVVGWIYDPENPDHQGDNHISLGIFDVLNEQKRLFVNGYEKSILIDPNVDGDIWSLMK